MMVKFIRHIEHLGSERPQNGHAEGFAQQEISLHETMEHGAKLNAPDLQSWSYFLVAH